MRLKQAYGYLVTNIKSCHSARQPRGNILTLRETRLVESWKPTRHPTNGIHPAPLPIQSRSRFCPATSAALEWEGRLGRALDGCRQQGTPRRRRPFAPKSHAFVRRRKRRSRRRATLVVNIKKRNQDSTGCILKASKMKWTRGFLF